MFRYKILQVFSVSRESIWFWGGRTMGIFSSRILASGTRLWIWAWMKNSVLAHVFWTSILGHVCAFTRPLGHGENENFWLVLRQRVYSQAARSVSLCAGVLSHLIVSNALICWSVGRMAVCQLNDILRSSFLAFVHEGSGIFWTFPPQNRDGGIRGGLFPFPSPVLRLEESLVFIKIVQDSPCHLAYWQAVDCHFEIDDWSECNCMRCFLHSFVGTA